MDFEKNSSYLDKIVFPRRVIYIVTMCDGLPKPNHKNIVKLSPRLRFWQLARSSTVTEGQNFRDGMTSTLRRIISIRTNSDNLKINVCINRCILELFIGHITFIAVHSGYMLQAPK